MKILFINLKDTEGGAAIAAWRLAAGLEAAHGAETRFLVARRLSADPRVVPLLDHRSETVREAKAFLLLLADRAFGRLGLQYVWLPFTGRAILREARRFRPDVICLQVIHGGYFRTGLLPALSRIAPLVWTLHDMWPFTANAANTFGDESWKEMRSGPGERRVYPHVGLPTGRWLLRRKRRLYARADLHPVAPSAWLQTLAQQSPVFAGREVRLIPHGVDLDTFRPLDKAACRQSLGLPAQGRVLLFVSADDLARSAWKGGALLAQSLAALDACLGEAETAEVLLLGKGRLPDMPELRRLRLRLLGTVAGDGWLRQLYNAADLFVYPTRADSLGLALVESIACGTPAVSFAVGGTTDVVVDGVSGWGVAPFDTGAFAARAAGLLRDRQALAALSLSARRLAVERFSLAESAAAYQRLFEEVAAARRNGN